MTNPAAAVRPPLRQFPFRRFPLGQSIRVAMLGVLVVLLAAVCGAGPAAAHSGVVGSSPEQGAQLDRSPGTVSVTFNEDIKPQYALLKVVGPDKKFWQQGEPTVSGRTLSVPVNALGPAGRYDVNFKVTSADGHPVQGQRSFELTVAGDGVPGPVADPQTLAITNDDHGFPVWAIVLIAVAVLVVIAGGLVLVLRRRGAGH